MIKIDAAIDYDNTYTSNPEVWTEVLLLMKNRGMKVICATNRACSEANQKELSAAFADKVLDIVYCEGYKNQACLKKGYQVGIWIDDDPRVDEKFAPVWWCKLVGAIRWVLKILHLE